MTRTNENKIKISIDFSDPEAISNEISEPDILIVKFKDPAIFVDEETGLPLSDTSFEKRISIGA